MVNRDVRALNEVEIYFFLENVVSALQLSELFILLLHKVLVRKIGFLKVVLSF